MLLTKILGLNDTQGGVVAMIFKYCDDNKLPLLDLKDFIKVLQYVGNEGKNELQATYGNISTTSTGTILRKVIELQQQGADTFFGEKSFEVEDLMRISDDGTWNDQCFKSYRSPGQAKTFFNIYVANACRIICCLP